MLIAENASLRFVWKPAGIPVFPPHKTPNGDCLLARLLAEYPEQNQDFPEGFAGGIAHRLDTLTSGMVVVAKNPASLEVVRGQWPRLAKFYRFQSTGRVSFDELVVNEPIAHHPRRADRVVVGAGYHRGKWREAWTRLRRLGDGWWEAEIHTGVLHQVRAHAGHAGIPLVGDVLYGGGSGTPVLVHVGIVGADWAQWVPNPPGPAR